MISLISLGISEYNRSLLGSIPCARDDAKRIYDCFQDVFRDEFSQFNSITIHDTCKEDFIKLLNTANRTYSDSDILVIYFTGHASMDGQNFFLCFNDFDDKGSDTLSSLVLAEELKKLSCKVLLVLDCCRSGGGLSLANAKHLLDVSNISVIASNRVFEMAYFDENGSYFTNEFISALKELDQHDSPITLYTITGILKAKQITHLVNVNEGDMDLSLKQNTSLNQWSDEFPHKFLLKINSTDFTTKELLWYSLMDVPKHLRVRILKTYFLDYSFGMEMSWLVRRAIGSIMNQFDINRKSDKEFLLRLLTSTDWTRVCIGLIGARYSMDDVEICNCMKNLLVSDYPMDVVWLANLYYSDSRYYDSESVLNSPLISTNWGLIEIWKTLSKKNRNQTELFHAISERVGLKKEKLSSLTTHLYFLKCEIPNLVAEEELVKSKLFNQLYKARTRNIINRNQVKNKWLISNLFGVWRDQINFDLKSFIDLIPNKEDVVKELELVSKYPLIEMRMAVLEFIHEHIDIFEKFKDSLLWSLNDPHPWVRRIAIKLFAGDPIIKVAFRDVFDRNVYPGLFDLFLQAKFSSCDGLSDHLKNYNLSELEKASLERCNIN